MQLLEFVGEFPAIVGQACEGLICEGYEFEGESVATANVTYLKFGGVWHRLSFDLGTVHWRVWPSEPEQWTVAEEGLNYPHIDVGLAAEISGVRLRSYNTSATERGARVVFEFENGRQVFIEEIDDHTTYQVITSASY